MHIFHLSSPQPQQRQVMYPPALPSTRCRKQWVWGNVRQCLQGKGGRGLGLGGEGPRTQPVNPTKAGRENKWKGHDVLLYKTPKGTNINAVVTSGMSGVSLIQFLAVSSFVSRLRLCFIYIYFFSVASLILRDLQLSQLMGTVQDKRVSDES